MSNDSSPPSGPATTSGRRIEELSPAKLALLAQLRARAGAFRIPRRAAGSPAPASFAQELLWQLDRSTPGTAIYNASRALRLTGPLDIAVLERSVSALVERHGALRTSFESTDGGQGVPLQQVHATSVSLGRVDVRATPYDSRAAEVERLIGERVRRPFDLAREPQFRVTLFTLADDEHVLLWESHHIAIDGASATVMFHELATIYDALVRGAQPVLPPLTIDFTDFAAWQRDWLSGARLDDMLEYWRTRLAGAPELLELPTDHPRPATSTFEGGQTALALPPATVAALKELARRHETTLYAVLVAVYVTLLSRYSGQEDVVIGSPVAGRTRAETEGLVGYLANTLVLRTDLRGDPTFVELLGRVRESWLSAVEHQEIPLEKLLMELRRDRQLAHAPLFQCVLTMEDAPPAPVSAGGVRIESLELDSRLSGVAKFDLLLLVSERAEGLRLLVQYRSELFDPSTIERMLGHLHTLIDAVLSDAMRPIAQLPLMTPAERERLSAWNDSSIETGRPTTIGALFAEQVARVPDRVAVAAGDRKLTYAELDARSRALGARLRELGVVPGARVALLLDRSAEAVVGLMGVMSAGAAFVPLSVDAPPSRITQQLADCGASLVVTSGGDVALPAGVRLVVVDLDGAVVDSPIKASAAPEDVAYVLYTSGSTGVPKGVAVTHANAVHYVRAVSRVLADVPRDAAGNGLAALDGLHFGLAGTLAADLGYTSLLAALAAGGTLHVLSAAEATEPARFAERVTAQKLDVLKITPGHLHALAGGRAGHELAALLPARWLVVGGEALRPALARTLLGAGTCRLLNHYGPTETTIGACTFEVTRASLDAAVAQGAQSVPIGAPLANMQAVVVDARGTEQPVGVPGELVLGGAGVATGYLGRAELTAERFGRRGDLRTYRSGDRVRRLPDGTIEFLGRADDQVKVRGYRVELGEIETVLAAHPGVQRAVVLTRAPATSANGASEAVEAALVAYVVPKEGGYAVSHTDRPTEERLQAWASTSLPAYMVPSAIVLLDALPLTANGKVDRAALPSPSSDAGVSTDTHVLPRTPTEEQLCALWAEVLKKERIGVTDSFLALGGHSLLAIRILGRISKTFGVRLPLRTLFERPTVEAIASAIDVARGGVVTGAVTAATVSQDGPQ